MDKENFFRKTKLILLTFSLAIFGLQIVSVKTGQAASNNDVSQINSQEIFSNSLNANAAYDNLTMVDGYTLHPNLTTRVRLTANAKGVCANKHDKPAVSKNKNYNHMDEDCCPDPDEWPNPGCAYSAGGFALMLKGFTPGHVHR